MLAAATSQRTAPAGSGPQPAAASAADSCALMLASAAEAGQAGADHRNYHRGIGRCALPHTVALVFTVEYANPV